MGHARQNPAGEFVHDHPWLTFFMGLAALNTVGWIAVLGIAAAQGSGAAAAPTFNQGKVVPIPTGTSPSVNIGSSLQMLSQGKAVASTSSNANVLAPAGGVEGGFVAVAAGIATVTSTDGQTTTVTVVSSGALGTGKPAAPRTAPRFVPRILRVA